MGSPVLGTGIIREDFQLSGRVPVERDMLKIAEIIGEIEEAVTFSMRGDILSRPIALLVSREQIRSRILSSVHKHSSGQGRDGRGRMSSVVIGGIEELKFFENRRLSRAALEADDDAGVPSPLTRVGMDLVPLLRLLTAFQKSFFDGLSVLKFSFFISECPSDSIPKLLVFRFI